MAPPAIAPEPASPTYYVHSYMLNLRACPRMDCSILATLRRGDKVEEILQQDGWRQVRVSGRGTQGWLGARFVAPSPPAAGRPPPEDGHNAASAEQAALPADATPARASDDPDPSSMAAGPGATPASGAAPTGDRPPFSTAEPLPTDLGPKVEEEFAP